jgi:hypothetical protein
MPSENPFYSWPTPSLVKTKEGEEIILPEVPHFDKGKSTLILKLDKKVLDLNKVAKLATENGLQEKPEFHVTVISFRNGKTIYGAIQNLPEEEREGMVQKISDLVDQTQWAFKKTADYLHLKRDYPINGPPPDYAPTGEIETRESYVGMLQSEVIAKFYRKLESLLNITFAEIPPPHTTLFTKSTLEKNAGMGIAINSPEDPSLKEAIKLNVE